MAFSPPLVRVNAGLFLKGRNPHCEHLGRQDLQQGRRFQPLCHSFQQQGIQGQPQPWPESSSRRRRYAW